jgi:3-isopropylmalate dehydrogenase
LVGVLPGEGIGPEVIGATLVVLDAVSKRANLAVEICEGCSIGRQAEQRFGVSLPRDVIQFCENILARGGAVMHGPGGGRFVYDLRRHFDLYFKISPLQATQSVARGFGSKSNCARKLDILIARENSGGVYQGKWGQDTEPSGGRLAWHSFSYSEYQVSRFLHASARLAKRRCGRLSVIWKESGLPSISRLWHDCALQAAEAHAVDLQMVDFDVMAYRLVQDPHAFDVVSASNLIGDVLADLGAALLGSRGLSFSGNYNEAGGAVYQTNHGSALDLEGSDRANPVGQIFALAMMLRESFGLWHEAAAIESAVRSVWSEGWYTEDVGPRGARIVGTSEMGDRVAQRAAEILDSSARSAVKSGGDEAVADTG